MMAKHPKRGRKFRKYLRGNADEQVDLTTLATLTLANAPFDDVVFNRTWVSTLIARWAMSNWTPIADVGPIMVGVAHSDYSKAEIEEFIENTASWNEGNLVQQEIAKRKIKIVGILENPADVNATAVLNDGKPIRTKCNWILMEGQTLQAWAYNLGTAAVATTVPRLRVQGHANLWPS